MSGSVVLVHGIRTSATMWRAQLEALEAAGIEAVAVDLPGHGARMAETFSLESALDTIDEAIDGCSPGPVLLCGLSLGGYLSLHYAAERGTGRIDGLIAAACGSTPRRVTLGGYRAIAGVIGALPDRGAALNQFMIDTFVPLQGRDDIVRGGVALEAMSGTLAAIAEVRPMRAISRLTMPVLFVNGQFDHFRLEERAYLAAARARPDVPASWSSLMVVPGASHLVSLVRPDEFSRIVVGAGLAMAASTW